MDEEFVSELQQLLTSAKHPRTIDLLQKALAEATSPTPHVNGDTEVNPPPEPAEGTGEPVMKPIRTTKENTISMAKINNYGWDQSAKFVKIYISDISGIDTIKPENIRSDFNQGFIKVELLDVCGKNYGLTINNLYAAIYPEKCTVKVKSGMVIVSLYKTKSEDWQFLTAREKRLKESKDRKPNLDDKADPGQSLMKLMQQMYDDGDDEMKRTIAKSWYESQEKRKSEGLTEGLDI